MRKKNLIAAFTLAFMVCLSAHSALAQSKVEKAADKTGKAIEKGAKAIGDKTVEVATKGASKVTDQTYKGKMAPDGSNVYIDGKNRKYYVDKKGEKIYLKASQIKDRPKA